MVELSTISDISIGMHSMYLLELAMIREDIISFRPNAKTKFIGNTLNTVMSLNNFHNFKTLDKKLIDIEKFRKRFKGSKYKIINYLKEHFEK